MKTLQNNRNGENGRSSILFAAIGLPLVALLLFSTSCDDNSAKAPEKEYYLTVNPKTVDFLNTGGKKTVTVTTNITDWNFSIDDDSWVTVAATSDSYVIELTANPNPDENRMTYLRLTSAAHSSENKVLEVRQGPTHLTVTPDEVNLDALGDEAEITVETNIDNWSYSLEPSTAADWLTVVKDGNKLLLTTEANPPGADPRQAKLIVSSAEFDLKRTVEVTQGKQEVTLAIDPDSPIEFEADGGDVTVTVTSNLDTWAHSLTLDPLDPEDWLTVEKEGNELKLTAKENPALTPRSATLKIGFAQFDMEETLVVTQKDQSPYLTISENTVGIKPQGETVTVTVTTNVPDWTYTVDPVAAEDWLTVVKEGNSLKLTAEENGGTSTLTATVTVSAGTLEESIAVSQAKVPVYDDDITATYLKNTGKPASPRFEYDAEQGYVNLSTGDPSNRWYHVTDWKTNEQARQNGNVDSNGTFQYGLCLPGNGSPAQYPIVNGKLYQTIDNLPAGRYRFIVTVRHKTTLDIFMVANKGDDMPDIDNPANGVIRDMSNVLGFASIPRSTQINQADTPFNVDFVLTETSAVSLGMVANVSAAQIIFYKFELWRESNP